MFSISIPVWLLSVCVGLPTLTLMTLVISLVRNKQRRNRKEAVGTIPNSVQEGFAMAQNDNVRKNENIHQMILDLQIDAVFQSLSTIIETEKVKLKTLVGASAYLPSTGFDNAQLEMVKDQPDEQLLKSDLPFEHQKESDVADQIAELTAEGVTPKVIAKKLGLSLSEVVLAIRIKQNAVEDDDVGYGLKAIA